MICCNPRVRSRPRKARRMNDRGFTLLELLLSILLLVLITGVLGGALHMAHSALSRGEKKVRDLETLKTSYALMEAQIQSLMPYKYGPDGPKIFFEGRSDKLRILTAYSIWRGGGGGVLATYDVVPGAPGKQNLKVTEQLPFQDAADETILFANCDTIQFEYFLQAGQDEGKWLSGWGDVHTTIPEKIGINLTCGTSRLRYEFKAPAKPLEVTTARPSGAKK
ncbi:MAG: prepilin-type N-terminal cleavage/methylation domain-containing protein [Deltaproteobacteria bacterium]|nr:prepilin-type N-terminal cleavage/methylation domain-containing protein [Deltaproteobacteria bacterium]